MKRRGFLGFAAGAVVAGPGMAKEAATKMAQDLALGSVAQKGNFANALVGSALPGSAYPQQSNPILQATQALAKIAGMTAEQRARRKRQMGIGAIDPDIAGYRSISLSAKIDWQKERQLNAAINEHRSMWQRIIDNPAQTGYDTDYDLF